MCIRDSFLRRFAPGYEHCYLMSSASSVGIRETRHFYGRSTLHEQDILSAKIFSDWVVTKAHFNFDVHNMDGGGLDRTGITEKFPQQKGYTIPYGCLLPKNVENLLLAGRDISGRHLAHSNYRVMPICANIGQAAGVAAALSVKQNVLPSRLNVQQLQAELMKQGVKL